MYVLCVCVIGCGDRKRLEPEKIRGMPLCMESYKWLSVWLVLSGWTGR